ncbi:MAG: RNA polymerase sigma-70 factor (ECF subfamily) [Verrucomicrobiales bacterium]|jgi:RNA polymerase sigma-70 factor (ECF subfamily)
MSVAVLQFTASTWMPEPETQLSDEELACQVQAGNAASFDPLVSRYEDKLYNFLKLKTADRRDAEELTQTTFVTAFQKIQLYKSEHAFATWLFTIARRLTIDHYRRNKNRPTTNALPEESAAHTLVESRTASDFVSESENHTDLWTTIREILNENQFTVMWLKYEQDLPVAEIAKVMKKTKTHVKVMLHRARKSLIAQLPEASPGIADAFTLPSPNKS